MNEHPLKISIATVTYNAGALLEKTIASVENQTYPYVEHVIVDGNSTDLTMEVIHHYQERNSVSAKRHEINILSESDNGLYDAMNKAIQMSTGNYILFLNAGDCLHTPQTLEKVVMAIQNCSKIPAVVYGDTDIVNDSGVFIRKRRLSPPEKLTWKSFRKGMLVCHQAFFASVEIAKTTPYQLKYRFSSDFDWCIRLMRQGEQLGRPLLNTHLIIADYLDGGLTTKNHRKSLWERFQIMTRHYGWGRTMGWHLFFIIRAALKK